MTKEFYYELCETMGNEPVEEEIPVEMSDLPDLVQQTLNIYYMLADIWDPVGGNYLGKNTTNLFDFFNLYDIEKEERVLCVSFIQYIDHVRSKIISGKKQTPKASK